MDLSKSQMGWMDLSLLLPYSLVQILCSSAFDRVAPR